MAMSFIKPASVAFVQTLFEHHNVYFQLEELTVSSHSSLANKALKESGLREKYGCQLLVINRDNQAVASSGPDDILLTGDELMSLVPRINYSNWKKHKEKAAWFMAAF
ncbi:MAG: TrkA C-terminal domain-containing protein [Firmicutes bacterium]|nr:TrkA C-terminal domain-containing protein [Bacillota bacterium]